MDYILILKKRCFHVECCFLWIFSRGMELGVIVLCLLPLRILLRKKVPRLFSYLLWAALPVNVVFNLIARLIMKKTQVISDYVHETPKLVVAENVVRIMKYVWFCGTLLVVLTMVCSYICFLRRLVGSIRLQKGIYIADRIGSPFTLGLLCPKIYLPISLKEEYYESVILHEQVHIARRDVWMKYLAVALLGLFWFQPILWFAYRLFVNDMEEACDETVLRKKGIDFREEYARSLLEVSDQAGKTRGVAIGYGNGEIKARIKNVMHYEQAGMKKCVLATILCCLFMIVVIPISWQVPRIVHGEGEKEAIAGAMEIEEAGIGKELMIKEK